MVTFTCTCSSWLGVAFVVPFAPHQAQDDEDEYNCDLSNHEEQAVNQSVVEGSSLLADEMKYGDQPVVLPAAAVKKRCQ